MKIADVRDALKGCTKDQLSALITDMYKAIPQAVITAKEIDDLITSAKNPKPKTKGKKATKVTPLPDRELLVMDVNEFIENAYAQNYFAPNRIISKKERPKWRFKVKQFYKDLLLLAEDKDSRADVADCLEKLYRVLCYSCGYYLFSTDAPFNSVGISQPEFFHTLMRAKKEQMPLPEFCHYACKLVLTEDVHYDVLPLSLFEELLDVCPKPEERDALLEACKALHKDVKTGRIKSERSYEKDDRMRLLAEMGFVCLADMNEFDDAVSFFNEYYPHAKNTPDMKLYVLLRSLMRFSKPTLFEQEYDRAVTSGISPRDNLKKAYQHLKTTGELPEYL